MTLASMMRLLLLVTIASFNLLQNAQAAGTAEDRAKTLINAELVFQPSVFTQEGFPSCDSLKPGEIRKWIGDYTFEVIFTDFLSDLEHVYGEAYPHLAIGKRHKYNGTSLAIGTKILEQMTGLTVPELYKEYLFDPLGCESIESIDASAMTWSNAYDLARLGQLLANLGSYGNKRFFSEETFEQMIPRKLDQLLGPDTKVTWGIVLTWFRCNGLSSRTIGHGSASSCTLRVDLKNDLVITMTRATAGKNFKKYHPRFIRAVTDGIQK